MFFFGLDLTVTKAVAFDFTTGAFKLNDKE